MNSTIARKKKKLSCGCFDYAFSKNRCKMHATIEDSSKRIAKADAITVKSTNNAELQRWFDDRRKEMTGVCVNCGGKTSKNDDKYYKFCIAHLLPKAYLKSIATHPDNWIELCYFGNSCHAQYDNHMIDLIDLNCFDSVIEKFVKIYPSIANDEKRRIPSVLMDYIEVEK
jgi:hypothetical protein